MSKLTLWIGRGSCSVAAHILFHEAELPFETINTSLRAAELEKLAHINPKKRVPILRLEDGTVITENPAIMTFVAQRVPHKHLLGRSDIEVVRSYEWFNWISMSLFAQGFASFWRTYRFTDDQSAWEGIQAKGYETIGDCFDKIEAKLDSEFAVGSAFTAVDAYLYVFYSWGNEIGFDMKNKYPRYSVLAEKVAERDSTQKVSEMEGISILKFPD